MSEREYNKSLNQLIDEIYLHWGTDDWVEFARIAGLSYATVRNLGCYQTKRPQLRTILKLAKAAKMKIAFDFRQPKVKLAA